MSFATNDPPSFRPFDNDQSIPQSRLSTASIWAPQPQPPDATWPRAFDSFSRVLAERKEHSELQRSTSFPVTREDVFGPIGFQNDVRKKDVGAIGEGRKKNSPDFDDTVRIC
jgi:pumilio RNA-binding family